MLRVPAHPRSKRLRTVFHFVCAAALLSVTGCQSGPAECLTNRQFFAQKVWAQVISKTCIKCHNPDGAAAAVNAKLLLLTPSYPAFLDADLATFGEVSKIQYDGVSEILVKPLGKAMHGGGVQMQEGSEEYQILSEMVARIKTPVSCPGASDPTLLSTSGTSGTSGGQNLVILSPTQTLRKAALALAGRIPTDAETEAVAEGGETALASAIDKLMGEPTFLTRLKEIYNDLLLTNQYAGNGLDLLSDADYPGKYWWNPQKVGDGQLTQDQKNSRFYSTIGIGAEPLELIAHVVKENRPFTEILTATYTMVNSYSAQVYGLDPAKLGFSDRYSPYEFHEAHVAVSRASLMLPIPHAGLLTQPVFLNRYSTTDTNLNRHRARMTFKFFLATDILQVAERPIDPSSVTSTNPTRDDPYCRVCHKMIDPVAGTFQKFDYAGRFMPDALWPTALPQPGFAQDAINDVGQYPAALQWLGQKLIGDPRFVVSALQTLYRGLIGREPLSYPADGASDFGAQLGAWQAEDASFLAISNAFVADHYNLKTLVRGLLLSPAFRTVNAAPTAAMLGATPGTGAAALEGYGTGSLLPPEQLARKIGATTGMHWWRGDKNEWLTNDYNLLYGGIDSVSVTTRLSVPNGIMVNVGQRMAEEISCAGTAWDFTKPHGARVLFPLVDASYRPEDENGYPIPAAIAKIRENIRYLHMRLLGEELSDGDPEVERTYQLFLKTYRELFQSRLTDLPYDCQGRWDRATFAALPQNQVIGNDPNYTIRSWMAVMTYLLSDWKFLYE